MLSGEGMQDRGSEVLPSVDAFERCALHGLCAFHGAASASVAAEGGRQVCARRLPCGAAAAPEASESTLSGAEGVAADVGDTASSADARPAGGTVERERSDAAPGAVPFTVVDVLMVLDAGERPGGAVAPALSAAALRQHRHEHYPSEWGGSDAHP